MLYLIIQRNTGDNYITDSALDYKEKCIDEGFSAEMINTNLSKIDYVNLMRANDFLHEISPKLNFISDKVKRITSYHPTDTSNDAEMIQIADDAVQCFEDLQRLVSKLLGKNIE